MRSSPSRHVPAARVSLAGRSSRVRGRRRRWAFVRAAEPSGIEAPGNDGHGVRATAGSPTGSGTTGSVGGPSIRNARYTPECRR
jgi:hypothetical protein